MLTVYPACFFHDEDGYSVMFPDLNHLSTCGDTLDEAMRMAVDCLAGYIHTCQMDGDEIPNPSPMNQIDIDAISREYDSPSDEAFVNMVSVDVEAYAREHFDKTVRKSLTIPAWLNDEAMAMGINFSQTLKEALITKVRAQR